MLDFEIIQEDLGPQDDSDIAMTTCWVTYLGREGFCVLYYTSDNTTPG